MDILNYKRRSGIDCMAEGMWKIAVNQADDDESWDKLPESQKEWWRSCADCAMRQWMGPAIMAFSR